MEAEASTSINTVDRASYVNSNETTPLQRDKTKDDGFRFILTTFTVVTIIITVALGVSISQHTNKVELRSGVVSDEEVCTNIGKELFQNGGNAVDVAVSVTICLGVFLPHLTGIGGNGLVLVYSQKLEKSLSCLDSWTPGSTGIPKLLVALYTVHSNYGKKPWKSLIEPSIKLAREGFTVRESLSQSKMSLAKGADPSLRKWLSSLVEGVNITSPQLAEALTSIRDEGPDAFYKGSLSVDLKRFLGLKAINDLKLNEGSCIEKEAQGFRIVSSGIGSGGPFLQETLSRSNITRNSSIQYLIEYFEGKEEMDWPLPSGVVASASDEQDLYVTVVSGLGPVLGSQNLSTNGYIFGTSLNYQKSSLGSIGSAFVAAEVSSRCRKRVITGGVDVRDLLQVFPGLVWSSIDIQTMVEGARVRFSANGTLAEVNHAPSLPFPLPPAPLPYSVINVIEKYGDDVTSYADSRGGL